MRLRVRVLGGAAPLWIVVAACVVPLLALTALLATGAARWSAPLRAPSTAPATTTHAAPEASLPAPSAASSHEAPPSQLELSELEAKPAQALTSAQVLARAAGRREREVSVARGLRESLEREPDAIKQKSMLLALKKLASNPVTAGEALAAMAALPGTTGPDLLYEIWVGTKPRPESAELARELLYSSDVRAKASAALGVALDLRAATSCDEARAAVLRAVTEGDRRSLTPLYTLYGKRGCGPGKKEDCYACLRDDDVLKSAVSAVKRRRAPSPFTAR